VERQRGLSVDDLPGPVDDPQAVLRGVVADRNVAASLKPMGELPTVPTVPDPGLEVAGRAVLYY